MLEIIFESFGDLFRGFDAFLKTRDLTIGAILAWIAPFILIWIKISKEKEKRARSILVERRQLQIAFNVNEIMEKLGVESKWSIQEIGSTHTVQPTQKKLFLLLQAVMKRQKRRMIMLTNILKANLSKKLISALVSIGIVALNGKFNLNLSENDVTLILGLSLAHISLQTIIDSVKAWGLSRATTIIHQGIPVFQNIGERAILDPNTTYSDLYPTIKIVHEGINKILSDVQKNDASQVCKDGMQAYTEIKSILDKYKQPQPLPDVPSQQESA